CNVRSKRAVSLMPACIFSLLTSPAPITILFPYTTLFRSSKFISAILTILFCTFWLFYYDWQLAIIAITAIPLLLMFFIPLGKILAKLSKTSQRLTAKLNVTAFEMLSEIKLIKAHTAERQQIHNGKENIEQLKAVGIKQVKWTSIINPVLKIGRAQ